MMNYFKRVIGFTTACAVGFALLQTGNVHRVSGADYVSSYSYENADLTEYDEFSDFGFITDCRVFDEMRFTVPSLINFGGEYTDSVLFRNQISVSDLIVIKGNAFFENPSKVNFCRDDKLIVYGDLFLRYSLNSSFTADPGTELWSRPSVFCSGKISSGGRFEIGSQLSHLNIYCGTIDFGDNSGVVYGNILTCDPSAQNTINGEIDGNLFSAGTVRVNRRTVVHGDMAVKGDLLINSSYEEIQIDGDLYVEGNIIGNLNTEKVSGNIYLANQNLYGEKIFNISDAASPVFDKETTDEVTFDDILSRGYRNAGNIFPDLDYFYEAYENAKTEKIIKNEFIHSQIEESFYEYRSENEITQNTMIRYISPHTTINVSGKESDTIILYFPVGADIEETEIIVDDDVKKCYLCFAEGAHTIRNSVIVSNNYYEKYKNGKFEIFENIPVNIEIISPDDSFINILNSFITANSYMNVQQCDHNACYRSDTVIYNGRVIVNEPPVIIGTLYDIGEKYNNIDDNFYFYYEYLYRDGCIYYVREKNDSVVFKSASLTLKDGVTLNYRIKTDGKYNYNTDGMYAVFRNSIMEKKVYISDYCETEEPGEYVLSIPVRPDCMTDVITAEIYDPDGVLLADNQYTVKDYITSVLEKNQYKKYHDLCTAMLRYGARAQQYTGFNADAPAYVFDYESFTVPEIGDEYTAKVSKSGDLVKARSASVLLGANTSVSVKFSVPEESDISFSCTDPETGEEYAVECDIRDGAATVTLKDVIPQNYDMMLRFSVFCGDSGASVDYSVFSYIRRMLSDSSTDTALAELLVSMYDYSRAADRLLGKLN